MKHAALAASILATSMVLPGCMIGTSPSDSDVQTYRKVGAGAYEDRQAESMAQEVAGAAINAGQAFNSGGMSKSVDGELNVQWQSWQYADGWWTRSGSVDGGDDDGNTLSIRGKDSVRYEHGGQVIQTPLSVIGLSADARSHGSVHILLPSLGEALLTADLALGASVAVEVADTVLTLSGTGDRNVMVRNADDSGRLEIAGDAVATDIKCKYRDGSWSKPYAGTLVIDGPYRHYDITFRGDTADIEITGNGITVKTTKTIQISGE